MILASFSNYFLIFSLEYLAHLFSYHFAIMFHCFIDFIPEAHWFFHLYYAELIYSDSYDNLMNFYFPNLSSYLWV